MESVTLIVAMVSSVAVLKVYLDYRAKIAVGVAQIESTRDGAEYDRGVFDGMSRAALIIDKGGDEDTIRAAARRPDR